MARYRKKPIEVEAYKTDKEIIIHTLEGDMKASVGDYIITGVKGEQYPCKPEIFEATYEITTADVVPKGEVDKLVEKLECLLCHATFGRLSKHTYDLGTMEAVVTDCTNETYNDGYGEGYKEAAREIFAEIELEIKEALDSNYKARDTRLKNKHEKREIPPCYCGDEIICVCDGKITAYREIEHFLAELKKKHTDVKECPS